MSKRPDGTLEADVLRALWAAPHPLTAAEVRERLDHDLAYTSVATVLSRLHGKGLVARADAGRGFTYRAAVAEATLAARRMADVLATASDRGTVLAGFVGTLSAQEAVLLRELLEGSQ